MKLKLLGKKKKALALPLAAVELEHPWPRHVEALAQQISNGDNIA